MHTIVKFYVPSMVLDTDHPSAPTQGTIVDVMPTSINS